jgi:hypothetical protein
VILSPVRFKGFTNGLGLLSKFGRGGSLVEVHEGKVRSITPDGFAMVEVDLRLCLGACSTAFPWDRRFPRLLKALQRSGRPVVFNATRNYVVVTDGISKLSFACRRNEQFQPYLTWLETDARLAPDFGHPLVSFVVDGYLKSRYKSAVVKPRNLPVVYLLRHGSGLWVEFEHGSSCESDRMSISVSVTNTMASPANIGNGLVLWAQGIWTLPGGYTVTAYPYLRDTSKVILAHCGLAHMNPFVPYRIFAVGHAL